LKGELAIDSFRDEQILGKVIMKTRDMNLFLNQFSADALKAMAAAMGVKLKRGKKQDFIAALAPLVLYYRGRTRCRRKGWKVESPSFPALTSFPSVSLKIGL